MRGVFGWKGSGGEKTRGVQLFSSQTHQNSISLNWEDYRRESKEQTLLLLDKNTLAPSNKLLDGLASLFFYFILFYFFNFIFLLN